MILSRRFLFIFNFLWLKKMEELKELARTSRDHAAALLKFVKQMDKPKSAGASGGGPSDVAELLKAAKKEGSATQSRK